MALILVLPLYLYKHITFIQAIFLEKYENWMNNYLILKFRMSTLHVGSCPSIFQKYEIDYGSKWAMWVK